MKVVDRHANILSDYKQGKLIKDIFNMYFAKIKGLKDICVHRLVTEFLREQALGNNKEGEKKPTNPKQVTPDRLKYMCTFINKNQCNGNAPSSFKASNDEHFWVYFLYEHIKKTMNLVDFNDMLLLASQMFDDIYI
eukprot:TRINITY_DN4465_c0_g2_i1.p2 TRINITY_DN4465_c0_g2~~TRINITY_DN4465_c0_g2_i1.p2  ORF type:complete len:136 (-),score=26.06 TRINITY_DN4465_c0_g2_i1:662-1069(-)